MIRHVVAITLREDAPAADIESFFAELGPISRHPKAIDYRCGWNFQTIGARCEIAISCAFATRANLDEYMASPHHAPPGAILRRIAERYSVIDYEEGSIEAAEAATRAVRGGRAQGEART